MSGGMSIGTGLGLDRLAGGGVNPPFPAPAGYVWTRVVSGSNRVVSNGIPVIALRKAA